MSGLAKWHGAQLLLAFPVEVAGAITSELHLNNGALYNSYMLIEFFIVLRMLHHIVPLHRTLWVACACAGTAALLVDFIFAGTLAYLLTRGILVVAFILTGLTIRTLWTVASSGQEDLPRSYTFWLLASMLVYFGALTPIIATEPIVSRRCPKGR